MSEITETTPARADSLRVPVVPDVCETPVAPRVVLAGGSGFLGRRLQRVFSGAGYDVVVLSRNPGKVPAPARGVFWDPARFGDWTRELEGATAVINLAGHNVNGRPTRAHRTEVLKSRLNSVRALAEAVRRCRKPPGVWVQAGSLAIYGDAGPLWCDENAPSGDGFAPEVCRKWENCFFKAPLPPLRRVLLRIGFVLGTDGGGLPVLARLAKWFAGAPAGTGRQAVSWIQGHDLDRIFLKAVEEPNWQGIYNACTAGPVANAELMSELRQIYRRPWLPAMPAWAVRGAAWLIGSDASLALTGQKGLPGRLMEAGFRFDYPALGPALDELLLGPRLPVQVNLPEGLATAAAAGR